MNKEFFGKTKAGDAALYTLENANHMQVKISDFGATIVKILVPASDGSIKDVVLGFDQPSDYEGSTSFFGAAIGRNANRIGKGQYEINGKAYQLDINDNSNNLHSGAAFSKDRLWTVEGCSDNAIVLSLEYPDGFQGFPGNVKITLTYTLSDDNALSLHYEGTPDQDTILNLTNHSYFNLNGHETGTILGHQVRIDSDAFTRTDAELIPTGEIVDVTGTPMDFRAMKPIGRDIEAQMQDLIDAGGYDQNWVLDAQRTLREVAECVGDVSGIHMTVFTDLPGIQMYTGNFVDEAHGKDGASYGKFSGVCFETQYFPDAVNHDNFESPICKAGEKYDTTTVYKFS